MSILPRRPSILKRPDPTAGMADSDSIVIAKSLDALFREAAKYGTIHIFQNDSGRWAASIKLFVNGPAKAEVSNKGFAATAGEALREALSKAQEGISASPRC